MGGQVPSPVKVSLLGCKKEAGAPGFKELGIKGSKPLLLPTATASYSKQLTRT